jgi:signal transduction histidine kinase
MEGIEVHSMIQSAVYRPTLLVVNRKPDRIARPLAASFHIETLSRPDRTMESARALQPDLILLSVEWPDAFALCESLKAEHAARFVPVILTEIANEQQAEICLESGADDLLPIQPDPAAIVTRVRMMLRQKRRDEDHHQELREALDAERRGKEMIELIINNIIHELNTPLLHIKSSVNLLEKDDGRDRTLLLEQARQAIARLQERTNDLSELVLASKPRKLDTISVSDVINSVLRRRSRIWKNENVARLKSEVARNLPLAWSDSMALTQILLQLVDNALKFSAGTPVIIRADVEGDYLRIAVQDEGIGIRAEDLPHIWEPFWTADHSTTKRYGGIGVGLTLAKRLADSLGIVIEIDSMQGEGTTVSFVVPLAQL